MEAFANVKDYENFAKKMLSPPMFTHINGEADIQDCEEFNKIQMKLRGLGNLKNFKDPLGTNILGTKFGSPIGFGPFPHQGMVNKQAEKASALAAADMNQVYVLSSASTCSIEEVVEATKGKGTKYFELDTRLPNAVIQDLVRRVSAHACFKGLVINAQYLSERVTENEWKNDFEIPPHLKAGTLIKYKDTYGSSNAIRDSYGLLSNKNAFKMSDVKKMKNEVRGDIKIIIKGVMCKEDALAAMNCGADAIWVSNGSHLKALSAPSTINVLKGITQSVKSQYPHAQIFVDSGARRGTDVMKCLAYGADAVFMSRPVVWGLHAGGYDGCKDIMDMLNEEIRLGMALTCCFKIADITEKQIIHRV